jgi:hypothetical protein
MGINWRRMRLFFGLRRQSPLTLMASCLSICLILVILKFSFHQDQQVVLAIVEEHHEGDSPIMSFTIIFHSMAFLYLLCTVLPYWFAAVSSGAIPQSGITLVCSDHCVMCYVLCFCFHKVHIDGHSDESIPEYISGMPFFRFPRDEEEVEMLMQKNDIFIQVVETK